MRFRVHDPSGLVIVRDSDAAAPAPEPGERGRPLSRLKELARTGQLFFIDGEDPVDMPLAVFANQPVPTDFAVEFEPQGGSFLLDVPSGRITVSGYDAWTAGDRAGETVVSVAPGSYLIVPHGRESVDAERYASERKRLIGDRDWTFHSRVSRLALLGCLPMIVLTFSLLGQKWRMAMYVALFVVLSWLPYLILSRTHRFRAIDGQIRAHDRALPVYLLELRPVERNPSMMGGWIGL